MSIADLASVQRFAAFSEDPSGGNPAGVLLDARHLTATEMQRVASDVGYSETAFITGALGRDRPIPVRYFAPQGEVDFCGHATIATAVAMGDEVGDGHFTLDTRVGPVEISTRRAGNRVVATLRSPPVDCYPLEPSLADALLDCFAWSSDDLDPDHLPAIGFAGNRHPVLVLRDLPRLQALTYNFAALQQLCRQHNWITIQLVVATGPGTWRARNPFPWGGVDEDPATGAAAAAFAGYLRSRQEMRDGEAFTITQGVEMGRPSTIDVTLTGDTALVTGSAVRIP